MKLRHFWALCLLFLVTPAWFAALLGGNGYALGGATFFWLICYGLYVAQYGLDQ